jgi:DNA-binding NtrC family response regulator
MMLDFDGHQTTMASGGRDALSVFASDHFDLVITDYSMPEMRGDQLAAEIKERCPRMPVILLTAFPPSAKPDAIDHVMIKPLYLDTLRDTLRRILKIAE